MTENNPPLVLVVGAAILERGRCLVARRGPGMSHAGRWEFPGGKVEPGESPERALVRELREEMALEIEVGKKLGSGRHDTGRARIQLDVYQARRLRGEPTLLEHDAWDWFRATDFERLTWADADVPLLAAVQTAMTCPDV